jgi:methionine-rich copper-binding protein CopC
MIRPATTLAVLVAAGALAFAAPASAHAKLQDSVPAKDATVSTPLTEVVLTFSEPLSVAAVQVLDKDGHEIKAVGAVKRDGKILHVPLTAKLPDGHYTVTWRVTGDDTHVVTGSLPFAVMGAH